MFKQKHTILLHVVLEIITLHKISNSESQLSFVSGDLLTPLLVFNSSVAVMKIIILTTTFVLITPKQTLR